MRQAFAQDRRDRGLRAPVHPDDEPEAEAPLVELVEPAQLFRHVGVRVFALLPARERGEGGAVGPDAGMGVEHRDALRLAHSGELQAGGRHDGQR